MMPRSVQATACTGIASTTSLAMTAPARRGGRRSMNCTRFPRRARWRSRSSALVSRTRYSRGDSPSRASASAPLPAPISSTGPPICLNCRASVRPNSLPSSGSLMKSPLRPKSAAKVKAELVAPIAPRALVGAALESFGRLDVVVNNASSFFAVPVGAIEPSHWEELIGSNLRAPLFISQEAAPQLAKNRGAIVNIIDIHGERPLKGYPVYSIAKAGLAALTRSLALELAPQVRVNGVAPGAIAL